MFWQGHVLSFFYLSNLGINAFHMGHPPSGTRHSMIRSSNLTWDSTIGKNLDDWGLGDCALETASVVRAPKETKKQEQASEFFDEPKTEEIKGERSTSHIKDVLSLLNGPDWNMPGDILAFLQFVSWYSLFHLPRNYLEIGVGLTESAGIVASACPSVKMCIARHMSGEILGTQLTGFLYSLTKLGHRSYFHLLNTSAEPVFEKLAKLDSLFPKFDLAVANLDDLGTEPAGFVMRLLGLISPGGAVVVRCGISSEFNDMWNELAERIVDSGLQMYRANGEAVGMLFNRRREHGLEGASHFGQVLVTFDPFGSAIPLEVPKRRKTLLRWALKGIWKGIGSLHDRLKDIE